MKKVLLLSLVLMLAIGTAALAGVIGSPHDMHSDAGITGTNQICVFCHHPHRGDVNNFTQGTLLWNYNSSNYTYTTTYVSDSMPANTLSMDSSTIKKNGGPAVFSLYCLGCHDGDTAADTLNTEPADAIQSGVNFTAAGALSGIGAAMQGDSPVRSIASNYDLKAEHPINFTVFPADDLGIITPYSSATLDMSGTDQGGFSPAYYGNGSPAYGASASVIVGAVYNSDTYPLWEGTLQCVTCHMPHNSDSGQAISFIRNDNFGNGKNLLMNSSICRDCHTNK